MALTIVTWNVNSIRVRLDGLARMIDALAPDIVCLQETKVTNPLFPTADVRALGFDHQAIHGVKAYGGVAILSRRPFISTGKRAWCGGSDARHVFATVDGGKALGPLAIHSLYVPAGGDMPDPAVNGKFAHKLAFLEEMAAWSATIAASTYPAVLAGDFNVAPLECDVWSHRRMLKIITHTPAEVSRLEGVREHGRWIDAVRHFAPPPERLSTWWSYRARDGQAADRGRRLDHLWVSASLHPHLTGMRILTEARDWPRPSDHVPLAITFAD